MTRPWQTLASLDTREGKLELRQRGDEFLIVIAGRVLMTSTSRRSEEALAVLACRAMAERSSPRVLVGGLGMAFTLRAALEVLPADAAVVVAELTPEVVEWCRGPLAAVTGNAVADPRVTVEVADVAAVIARSRPGGYDAIILDLYEGPHAATQNRRDPFYGEAALIAQRAALARGGILAVWSEEPDSAYAQRLTRAGFAVATHREGTPRRHVVYLATKQNA